MPNVYYTATHVKLLQSLLIFMTGITFLQAHSIRRLVKAYAKGQRRFDNLKEAGNYLLNVIEENDIDLSEFDVIALTSIFEESPND